MWADAIAKDMKNVQVAFDPIENGVQPPNGVYAKYEISSDNSGGGLLHCSVFGGYS